MKERYKKIAHQLVDLEKIMQEDKSREDECSAKIMKLIAGLDIGTMIEIDNYILKNNLLTK